MNLSPADERRFLDLVTENRQRILKVCRVYAWNAADQDDLYQDILFQIWRSLPGLRQQQIANTWLYRVAIYTAISFVRKRGSHSDRVKYVEHDDLTRRIESQQTPSPSVDDRLAKLYTAIAKLDPLEKALVTLFLEEFSYDQMAEITGISASNVGVMLHRAKKKLSTLIQNEEAA